MAIGSLVTAVHTAADNLAAALEDLHVDPAKRIDVEAIAHHQASDRPLSFAKRLGRIVAVNGPVQKDLIFAIAYAQ